MKYKILNTIGEGFSDEAKKILEDLGEVDYFVLNQKELVDKIREYDILIIGIGLVVNEAMLKRAKKLKVIACPATGLDHIDSGLCCKAGVEVLGLRGETDFLNSITGTAELAFGLIINLLRKIPFAFDDARKGNWCRDNFRGYNLFDKTLGIVGLGRLGEMTAQYAIAFGMKVIAFDPYKDKSNFVEGEVEQVSFEELLKRSDVISLHIPLNKETENMFNEKAFFQMKPSCFLVNTSRGKIVDENVLLKFLENKKVAGYATDVLVNELNFKEGKIENCLLVEYAKKNNNVIITPHIGGMTFESREATDIFIAEKIKKFLERDSSPTARQQRLWRRSQCGLGSE